MKLRREKIVSHRLRNIGPALCRFFFDLKRIKIEFTDVIPTPGTALDIPFGIELRVGRLDGGFAQVIKRRDFADGWKLVPDAMLRDNLLFHGFIQLDVKRHFKTWIEMIHQTVL